MTELVLRNRQRTRPVNSPLLRRMTSVLLTDLLSLERYDLAIHLVAAPEMARVNQQFLDHPGSTDVITFDYTGKPTPTSGEDRGAPIKPSTPAARRRSSRSSREARTGGGSGRGVSELGRQPSSARPTPSCMGGGEGGDGSSRRRPDPMEAGDGGGYTHFREPLHGEIFICIDDAVKQARHFRTTWQSELVRYLIHGLLHMVGYDDLTTADRREMKREENRLLRALSRQFSVRHLANSGPSAARKPQIVNRATSVSLSKPALASRVRS